MQAMPTAISSWRCRSKPRTASRIWRKSLRFPAWIFSFSAKTIFACPWASMKSTNSRTCILHQSSAPPRINSSPKLERTTSSSASFSSAPRASESFSIKASPSSASATTCTTSLRRQAPTLMMSRASPKLRANPGRAARLHCSKFNSASANTNAGSLVAGRPFRSIIRQSRNVPMEAQTKLTDCHVHLAALPDGQNGCYISPKMLKSPLFRFLIWKHDFDLADPATTNAKYIADLLSELRGSLHIGRAVLLAMDGAYDQQGKLDERATEFLIGNDYVLKVAKAYPDDFYAAVSINPQRRDAVEELHRCAEAGAKLVKVLPNAQQFDPGDRRFIPFYRALAQVRLPLLSHVGYEFSLIGKDQSAGDPEKLRVPLDEGVTVISAHGCSYA